MVSIRPRQSMSGLVPEHASFYLEVDHPLEILKNMNKGLRFYANPSLTFFAEWQDELSYTQQLLEDEPSISRYFKNATIGISAHVLTGKEAGYLFYFPVNKAEQESVFSILKRHYGNSKEYTFRERQYLNTSIAEITFKKDGKNFSVSESEGTVFGSFSGFLVEEVIRKSGLIFKPNFAEKLKRDHRYSGIAGKPVRLFLNPNQVAGYFYQYLNANLHGLKLIPGLGDGIAFGIGQPSGLDWVTEGYLINENPKEKGKHKFGLRNELRQYLLDSEAFSFHVSMADIWSIFPGRKAINTGESDNLTLGLESEFLLAFFEGEGLKKYDHLLVFKIKNQQNLNDWLQEKEINSEGKSQYSEIVGRSEIRQHSNMQLGMLLAGNVLSDWSPIFYTRDGENFLVSDDVDVIRRALTGQRNDKAGQQIYKSALIKWQANINRCIPFLSDYSAGVFKKNFQEWVPLFKGIQEVVLEDNGEEENPGINLTIKLRMPGSSENAWKETHHKIIDSTATTPPIRLEWKAQNRFFWAIQDKKLVTHILDQNLAEVTNFKLFGPWINRPQLLEHSGSKKTTVMVSTSKSIRFYGMDGVEENPSPILIPDSLGIIEHSRAIDYDQSNQYRILASSRYGDVYMADMNGKFLEGWNPFKQESPLSLAPRHVRIGERDLIILLDKNGKLLIVNRKGETQPGFPVQLSGRTDQPIYIEPGLDLKTSYIYVLSELGKMEKINFEGVSTSTIQLFRPEKDTKFQFCMDQRQKTFAIARVSTSSVTVFDQSYRSLFEIKIPGKNCLVQHFHFGASHTIFSVFDSGNSTVQLYNEIGQLINPEPIPCSQPVDIIPQPTNPNGFVLVSLNGQRVSMTSFEKD